MMRLAREKRRNKASSNAGTLNEIHCNICKPEETKPAHPNTPLPNAGKLLYWLGTGTQPTWEGPLKWCGPDPLTTQDKFLDLPLFDTNQISQIAISWSFFAFTRKYQNLQSNNITLPSRVKHLGLHAILIKTFKTGYQHMEQQKGSKRTFEQWNTKSYKKETKGGERKCKNKSGCAPHFVCLVQNTSRIGENCRIKTYSDTAETCNNEILETKYFRIPSEHP